MSRLALLLLTSSVALGCYSTYTVIAWGPHNQKLPSDVTAVLRRELNEALASSCMKLVYDDQHPTWSTRKSCKDAAASLEGVGAHVSVALDPADLTITVRDFDNAKRTAFVAYLEAEISEVYDRNLAYPLDFKRQSEFLVPNS